MQQSGWHGDVPRRTPRHAEFFPIQLNGSNRLYVAQRNHRPLPGRQGRGVWRAARRAVNGRAGIIADARLRALRPVVELGEFDFCWPAPVGVECHLPRARHCRQRAACRETMRIIGKLELVQAIYAAGTGGPPGSNTRSRIRSRRTADQDHLMFSKLEIYPSIDP